MPIEHPSDDPQKPAIGRRVFDAREVHQKTDHRRNGHRHTRRRTNPKLRVERPDQSASSYAQTWWGQHWIENLEHLNPTYIHRFIQSVRYLNNGDHVVLDFQQNGGHVEVKVKERRHAEPFQVSLHFKALTQEKWKEVVQVLATRAAFSIALLSGEMPEDMARRLEKEEIHLFPKKCKDFKASCSCKEWGNPCKHVATAQLALASALDQNPFLIFNLRGQTHEGLIEALRKARSGQEVREFRREDRSREYLGVPLYPQEAKRFFYAQGPLSDFRFHIAEPEIPLQLIRRLGNPSIWTPKVDLARWLAPIYEAISARAAQLGLDETHLDPSPPSKDRQSYAEVLDDSPSGLIVVRKAHAKQRKKRVTTYGKHNTYPSMQELEEKLRELFKNSEDFQHTFEVARQVLWALHTHGAATIRQLARRTRLKKNLVIQIIYILLHESLIQQEGQDEHVKYVLASS